MAYRPFYASVSEGPLATVATTATVGAEIRQSVANVATVAGATCPADAEAEAHYLFEERAAILEYDCGLSREEAERLAHIHVAATRH